jgi:hypothetical protein
VGLVNSSWGKNGYAEIRFTLEFGLCCKSNSVGEIEPTANLVGQTIQLSIRGFHVQQLNLSPLVRTCSVSADKLAQARAVDIAHVAKIQQEIFLAPSERVLYGLAHRWSTVLRIPKALFADHRSAFPTIIR